MSNHEIEKIMIPDNTSGPLVTIFDCFNRKSAVLQPEEQAAHVMQACDSLQPDQNRTQAYSYPVTRLLGAKLPPNVSVEDLGDREIEGIIAHGVRTTVLGTEKDGEEWKALENSREMDVRRTWCHCIVRSI
jgi:hypothetical protein